MYEGWYAIKPPNQISHLNNVCEESSTITQFPPPESGNKHAVLLSIHAKNSCTKISVFGCQSEDRLIFIYWWKASPQSACVWDVTSHGDLLP